MAARRRQWVQTLSWTDAQLAVLDRAEQLRYYSADSQAMCLVARECQLPDRLTVNDVPYAARLDLARWHRALTGRQWDGSVASFVRARNLASRHRHDPVPADPTQPFGVRAFRTSHLLVEPLDAHPKIAELRDYTRLIGWPNASNVGRLEWDSNSGRCCVFCDALLLPSEAQPIRGTVGAMCGKHCCAKG